MSNIVIRQGVPLIGVDLIAQAVLILIIVYEFMCEYRTMAAACMKTVKFFVCSNRVLCLSQITEGNFSRNCRITLLQWYSDPLALTNGSRGESEHF
jgi:hypothetical protein